MARDRVHLEHGAPRLEEYCNALATPTRIKWPPDGSITGCLYTEDLALIPLSQRFGGFRGDFFPSRDPDTLPSDFGGAVETLPGRTLYLGHYMPHFGHFLLETLSTFWVRDRFQEFDTYLFQPFVFGVSGPGFVEEAFELLGLDSNRIRFVERTTRLESVTVPARLTKLNQSVYETMREVYGALKEASGKLAVDQESLPARVYISRARVSRSKVERAIVNEPLIERLAERCGFTVVYPETLTLAQQVRMFASADVVCGLSGSALHQCVFMRPGSELLEIGDVRSGRRAHPMQELCNMLSDCTAEFLPFRGFVLSKERSTAIASTSEIGRSLRGRSNKDEHHKGSLGSSLSRLLLAVCKSGHLMLLSLLRLARIRLRERAR